MGLLVVFILWEDKRGNEGIGTRQKNYYIVVCLFTRQGSFKILPNVAVYVVVKKFSIVNPQFIESKNVSKVEVLLPMLYLQ